MKSMLKLFLALGGAAVVGATAIGLSFLAGGCSTIYSRAEFEEVVATTNRDTLGSVYYKGRKEGYDYFKANWNVGSKNLRIAIDQSPITDAFAYTRDETRWRAATFMHLEGAELELAIPEKLNAEPNRNFLQVRGAEEIAE
ncbi:hypothetical protein [Oceaniferula flava]|uniref:Lipoprotein n=1 Tax=Oceaniferula flava TaxID=2800421 RepID=A0AAE2SB90_9BACT|nr:hypothetical protein [Oceaniferula flavus]MBK1853734.1 hypothetical protein [Oceaniferula flavus]